MDILAIKKYNIYIQKDLQCGKRLKQRGKTPMIWQKNRGNSAGNRSKKPC